MCSFNIILTTSSPVTFVAIKVLNEISPSDQKNLHSGLRPPMGMENPTVTGVFLALSWLLLEISSPLCL